MLELVTIRFFFFFNDTATTEIYTLSLHDALPISDLALPGRLLAVQVVLCLVHPDEVGDRHQPLLPHRIHRSEEHTSELQSRQYLGCRLLLEKKKLSKHREPGAVNRTKEVL